MNQYTFQVLNIHFFFIEKINQFFLMQIILFNAIIVINEKLAINN